MVHHKPVSNKFPPLSDTPSEEKNGNFALETTIVKYIPGARACDVESYWKEIAKDKHEYSKIVIHDSGNDTRLRQSEVTKINAASVCNFAKTISISNRLHR